MQKTAASYATLKDMWVTALPDKTLVSVPDIKFAQCWNLILFPYSGEQLVLPFLHFCQPISGTPLIV